MILIVDMNCKNNSLGYYEFVLPIIQVVKSLDKCDVRHYLNVGNEELTACDAIILSGTPLKDNATLSQPEKFQWLKKTEKPVLGICAGMETIGVVYGMHLKWCLEIGMIPVNIVQENPLVSGCLKAYSLHTVCVEPSADFEIWAKSPNCVQMIKHKCKNIYGTLFHPEVRNQEVIRKFIQTQNYCGRPKLWATET
jgi:GMP synthase-like glutamine amidotransferase